MSIARRAPSKPQETPVRDALMAQLSCLAASMDPNKTSGVDRQIRHIGHYVERSSSVRDMQKVTLQDVAASVGTYKSKIFILTYPNLTLSQILGTTGTRSLLFAGNPRQHLHC